jgi:hypothetical protein
MPATPNGPGENSNGKDIPSMQLLLESPFLLLFIGVTVPTVIYLIWGIMEVASVPLGK